MTFADQLNTKKANDQADAASDKAIVDAGAVLEAAKAAKATTAAAKGQSDSALAAALFARSGDLADTSVTPPVIYRSVDGKALASDPGIGLDEPIPAAASVPPAATAVNP